MNKEIRFFILGLIALGTFGCQKKLDTWSGKAAIYFKYAEPDGSATPTDSISNTFAFTPNSTTTMTVPVPVAVMGALATVDRSYKVTVVDSSTVATGKQFTLLNPSFVIKAGKINDTIWVKFTRTPEMQSQVLSLYLKLEENESFIPNLQDDVDANGKTTVRKSFISVKISDILTKPTYWIDPLFGTFSRKKLMSICDLNGLTPAFFSTPPPPSVGYIYFLARFTQRWLNEQNAEGNTVYEDDGVTRMSMGPAAQ